MPAFKERAVRFGRDEHLQGVVTLPRDATVQPRACLIMVNSGILHRVGASRIHVELARTLSRSGVASLRFDFSGIGESDVVAAAAQGVQEMIDDDLDDAVDFAHRTFDSVPKVAFGLCSGAHDLVRAVDRKAGLQGVVMLDLFGDYKTKTQFMRHYGRRVRRLASWKNAVISPAAAISRLSRRFAAGAGSGTAAEESSIGVRPILPRGALETLLDGIAAKGPRALFVFTAGLEDNYNYREQFADVFPVQVRSPRVSWEYLPEANHLFTSEAARRRLIEVLAGWMIDAGFAKAGD